MLHEGPLVKYILDKTKVIGLTPKDVLNLYLDEETKLEVLKRVDAEAKHDYNGLFIRVAYRGWFGIALFVGKRTTNFEKIIDEIMCVKFDVSYKLLTLSLMYQDTK